MTRFAYGDKTRACEPASASRLYGIGDHGVGNMRGQLRIWVSLGAVWVLGCGATPGGRAVRDDAAVGTAVPTLERGTVRVRLERKRGVIVLVPERSCADGFCDGPGCGLGPATGFPTFTLLDLAGDPGPLPEANQTLQLSARAAFPAALVTIENARKTRRETVLHLVDLRHSPPRPIWRYTATARYYQEKGRGVDLDSARLLRDEDERPLLIEIHGTRRRHIRDGAPAKPTTPFTVRFRFTDGGEYRRL
jgi:hypothetical protein